MIDWTEQCYLFISVQEFLERRDGEYIKACFHKGRLLGLSQRTGQEGESTKVQPLVCLILYDRPYVTCSSSWLRSWARENKPSSQLPIWWQFKVLIWKTKTLEHKSDIPCCGFNLPQMVVFLKVLQQKLNSHIIRQLLSPRHQTFIDIP